MVGNASECDQKKDSNARTLCRVADCPTPSLRKTRCTLSSVDLHLCLRKHLLLYALLQATRRLQEWRSAFATVAGSDSLEGGYRKAIRPPPGVSLGADILEKSWEEHRLPRIVKVGADGQRSVQGRRMSSKYQE